MVKLVCVAYRGELADGEHAEYTLLERKLVDRDVRGSTLFTTLEPCTTRNHPKRPCAVRVIDRGISRVVIGMLDPNPIVYERGLSMLRDKRVVVDFYPDTKRQHLLQINESFRSQFHASPSLEGTAMFNHTHNDGRFTIGNNDLVFHTR